MVVVLNRIFVLIRSVDKDLAGRIIC
jgi:hypothetical protein